MNLCIRLNFILCSFAFSQWASANALLSCRGINPSIEEVSIVRGTKNVQILIRKKIGPAQSYRLLDFEGLFNEQAESIVFAKDISRAKSGTLVSAGILGVDDKHETGFLALDKAVFKLKCSSEFSKKRKQSIGSAVGRTKAQGLGSDQFSLRGLEPEKSDKNVDVSVCISKMNFEKATTLQECQKLRLEMPGREECSGPRGMAVVENQISKCYDQVLQQEFTKRMTVVKINNDAQYRNELRQQKSFQKMRDEICNSYNSCNGGWAPSAVSNCRLQLTGYRHNQIQKINEMNLAVKNKKYGGKKWNDHANLFADLICRMPPAVWSGDKAPNDCQQRVLGEVASFNGIPLPGLDPCDDGG